MLQLAVQMNAMGKCDPLVFIVKTMFYSYGVDRLRIVLVLILVLINLRYFYHPTDRPTVFFSINVVLLLYISVLCLPFILLILCLRMSLLPLLANQHIHNHSLSANTGWLFLPFKMKAELYFYRCFMDISLQRCPRQNVFKCLFSRRH